MALVLAGVYLLVGALQSSNPRIERDKITAAALAQAKQALIGYAASADLWSTCLSTSCPRPGELPCPDNWPQGSVSEGTPSPCSGNAIGRLPWKKLGLPDLRDSSGERLWYAVSTNYKNNPRVFPLNSDTQGTISVRDSNGTLIADATAGAGVVAVVISPSAGLTRQDGVAQDRSTAGYLSPINYLDIANGEDNQNFVNGLSDGFIQGPIKDASNLIIFNDTLIVISRDDIIRVAEKRVAAEVTNALLPFLGSLPNPAAFSDTSCLGSAAITAGCNSVSGNRGRIPANPDTAWAGGATFLNGIKNGNWYQQNAWREVIYYATGALTLNNPPAAITGNQVLVIMTGSALAGQPRTSSSQRGQEDNYLEEENLIPLDNTYTLRPITATTPFNDKVRCLPVNSPQC